MRGLASETDEPLDYTPASTPLIELTVPTDAAGMRIDQALADLLPEYSRSRLSAWLKAGHIRLDGKPVQPKDKVWGGEVVCIAPEQDPREVEAKPEAIAIDIRHEDASILVLHKPAGLVVHPGSGNWTGTLLNALLNHSPALAGIPRGGIVHRLDKDTSGLLVVAKTLTAQTNLVRQLQDRSVTRAYLAIARGDIDHDQDIEAPIGRHPVDRTRMAVVPGGRFARTRVHVLQRHGIATVLECRLDTGRTHQIRVHLTSLGHPLVGERTYGGRRMETNPLLADFPRQALHARRLELVHPESGERMGWEADPPADLSALLDALAKLERPS